MPWLRRVSRRLLTAGTPARSKSVHVRDLWWIKWHSDRFFFFSLRVPRFSPVSIISHRSSTLGLYHLRHCTLSKWLCCHAHEKSFRFPPVLTVYRHVALVLYNRDADFGELHEEAIDRCKLTDPLKQFKCQYKYLLIGSMGES